MADSPERPPVSDDEPRPEYDFRSLQGVVRGKHVAAYHEKLRVVRLADDVAAAFPDEDSVNAVLRSFLAGGGQPAAM